MSTTAKKCILFSGGWDSVAVALMVSDAELVFFDYGQKYMWNELMAANEVAKQLNKIIRVQKMNLEHDIERRNMYFLMEAKRMGYQHIITGNRNVLPLFDKYKDSNWFSLKVFGWLTNIKVEMPIIGWGKKRIYKYVSARTKAVPYNCYNNENDFTKCGCVNCVELRKVVKSVS